MRPMVLVTAPVETRSGYGNHSRDLIRSLIDIDKFMIPQKEAISQTAFYAVAVFIATVVEIPGRAMFQIINPLVAKALNENNIKELSNLYSKSSINLLIVAGLFFLLININIEPFYNLMSNPSYGDAIWVVLMISLSIEHGIIQIKIVLI